MDSVFTANRVLGSRKQHLGEGFTPFQSAEFPPSEPFRPIHSMRLLQIYNTTRVQVAACAGLYENSGNSTTRAYARVVKIVVVAEM